MGAASPTSCGIRRTRWAAISSPRSLDSGSVNEGVDQNGRRKPDIMRNSSNKMGGYFESQEFGLGAASWKSVGETIRTRTKCGGNRNGFDHRCGVVARRRTCRILEERRRNHPDPHEMRWQSKWFRSPLRCGRAGGFGESTGGDGGLGGAGAVLIGTGATLIGLGAGRRPRRLRRKYRRRRRPGRRRRCAHRHGRHADRPGRRR